MFSYKFSKNTYEPYQTKEQHNGKNNTMKPSSIYNSIVCSSNFYMKVTNNNQKHTLFNFM